VIATIVQLQNWEPTPRLPERYADFAQELIRTRGKNVLPYEPARGKNMLPYEQDDNMGGMAA